jgi:SAM-dependent methyltransferase
MDEREWAAIEERLRHQIEAYHEAALVFAAVTLGVPDRIAGEARSAAELATELNLSTPHLHRFLRGLATLNLCEELPDGRFALTPAGQSLTSRAESSLREKVLIVVDQYWLPWVQLLHCLETGEPSFPNIYDMPIADWRRVNPEQGALFQRYLAKEELAQASALLEVLDVTAARTVASIGGGYGGLLIPFLWGFPNLQAVLFDAPQTVEAAMPLLRAYRVAERVRCIGGDVLTEIPVKADLYVLRSVLQQRDDIDAVAILRNCRKVMQPGARLAIIERLLPERATDDPAAVMLDLHMMVTTGGRARSLAEFEALLAQSDLKLTKIDSTRSGLSVLEAVCT